MPADLRRAEALLTVTRGGPVGIGHDQHPFGPGEPAAARRHRHRGRPAALRPFGRRRGPARALRRAARRDRLGRSWAACSRPGHRRRRASRVSEMVAEVMRRVADGGWRVAGVDLTIVAAAPAAGRSSRFHADRDRDVAGDGHERGQRQGVERQPRRRRGCRAVDLGGRDRVARGGQVTVRLHDTLTGETRPFVPEGEVVGVYSCGSDGLWSRPRRQLPLVPVRRPAGPPPALARSDGPLGHERHRCRRQDHPGRRGGRDRHRGARGSKPGGRFLADAASLRMTTPDVLPRATEHIDRIVGLIGTLLQRTRLPHR